MKVFEIALPALFSSDTWNQSTWDKEVMLHALTLIQMEVL